MVVGYFLHKEKYLRMEDKSVTLPANKRYSTIFKIISATGTWNTSGPDFSEIHVYTCTMLCLPFDQLIR